MASSGNRSLSRLSESSDVSTGSVYCILYSFMKLEHTLYDLITKMLTEQCCYQILTFYCQGSSAAWRAGVAAGWGVVAHSPGLSGTVLRLTIRNIFRPLLMLGSCESLLIPWPH